MSKYGNVRTRGYDSRKEARRAEELRLLARAGKIRDLREQVRFELIPAQYEGTTSSALRAPSPQGEGIGGRIATSASPPRNDKRRKAPRMKLLERRCEYIADFVYVDENGEKVVEDAKGYRTKDYIIKRKLMLWVHGIRVREV